MSQNKEGGMSGGSGVYASTHFHYVVVYVPYLGGGWGAPGSGCIQRAVHLASGALYESTWKRLQPAWPRPTGPTLPCSGSHLATPGGPTGLTATPLQAPLANNSHSAGYQPQSLRINYCTGPVSLILNKFYTTLILNINSFFFLF